MPKRGTLLSEFDQGKIIGMTESGRSISDISRHISRSYNCIKKFWQETAITNMEEVFFRKLRERNKRKIIRKMSTEGAKALRKIKSELNLSVSKDTVKKIENRKIQTQES